MSFLRDALLVAGKDLRIERRSRVALQQIIPFGGVVVLLFAFALDSDRTLLHQAAPGLFWAAVLLAVVLAVGRSFAIEEANRARDGLRLSGLDGGSIFLGKAAAVAVELFLLEVIVGAAVLVLYDVSGAWSSFFAQLWPPPSDWRPPVRSTACWPEDCARARPSFLCSCSRRSLR